MSTHSTTICPLCGISGGWHDSKCLIGRDLIAAERGELEDAPPIGRTPQRKFSDIKKDYGL
jgi:hypothetical protein